MLLIALSLSMFTGCGKKEEPVAVRSQKDLQIDSGGDGSGMTPSDNGSSEYDIPAGSIIIDEQPDSTVVADETDSAMIIEEESGSEVPGNAVIIDEEPSSGGNKKSSGYDIPEGSVIIDEPANTKAPKPTQSPAKPTSAPVTPSGTILASGSTSSNTGTTLNLIADWNVSAVNDSTVAVNVNVSIASGSLQCKAVSGSVTVSVNGASNYLNGPAINVSGGGNVTKVGTASFSVNLPVGSTGTIPISASWRFGGTYSGVSIDTVACSDSVTIKR